MLIGTSISLLFLLCQLQPTVGGQRFFNQTCQDDTDCDESRGLTCVNQVCQCTPYGETIHSFASNRCVGAAGKSCYMHPSDDANIQQPLCIENSTCHQYRFAYSQLCICDDNFYQTKDGQCAPVAKYGQACRDDEQLSCGDRISTSIR